MTSRTFAVSMVRAVTALVVSLLLPIAAHAQAAMPQSKTWSFKEIIADGEYASPPFREMVQGRGGLLYVSDRNGVLEFDGVKWRRLALPETGMVTALGITDAGEIIVGASERLLMVTSNGHEMQVQDLREKVPGGLVGLGNLWEFASASGQWCLRSERKLLCKDAQGMFVLPAQKRFGRLFAVRDQLYVRDAGHGLKRVAGRGLELVEGGEYFADKGVSALIPHGEKGMLGMLDAPFGIAVWDVPERAPVQIRKTWGEATYDTLGFARALADGSIGLPYGDGDLLILDAQWNEVARFRAAQFGALPGAKAIHVDHEGGIWVAWDNAITRIDWHSPVSLFPEPRDIPETTAGVIENGRGVLAHTRTGFSRLRGTERAAVFESLTPRYPWIASALSHGDDFLALTKDGVWSSEGRPLVLRSRQVFSHFIDPAHPDEILLGLRFGAARIRKVGTTWVESGLRDDVSFEVAGVLRDAAGRLWLSSNVGRIALLTPGAEGDALTNARLVEFDKHHGVPPGEVDMRLLGGDMLIGGREGFFEFAESRFVPSKRLPFEQTGPVARFLVLGANELLVASPSGRIRLLARGMSGTYAHQDSVFDGIAALGRIQHITVDRTGAVWLTTDSGVVRVNPGAKRPATKTLGVLVRDISSDARNFFSGYGALPALRLDEGESIRFGFALPSYRAPELNRYRSRIRSHDGGEAWSQWSNESWRDFTNLPAGELVFEVEARDEAGASGGSIAVPITVVAPWYRRTLTMVVFWLSVLALLYGAVQWRIRALRARSVELERLVAAKTEALLLAATTDPLTGLWNRHRFGDWMHDELPALAARAASADADAPEDIIVCGIDLDHFKAINDQHGHAAGDAVLKAFAQRLLAMKGKDDLVFRFGGEEFVYIGLHRHRDEGAAFAGQIVDALRQTMVELESGVLLDPTASVGWSAYPFYRERSELFAMDFVLGVADRALYMAKRLGRDRAVGYLPNLPVDEIDRTHADWRAQLFQRHPDFLKTVVAVADLPPMTDAPVVA